MARRVSRPRSRQVKWTELAWKDLERTADYLAEDSPSYAAVFVREVRDAARLLKLFALRGRQVPELEDPDIRQLIVKRSYRLIYRADERVVYVLALIHGARDLPAVWRKRSEEATD